MDKWVEQKLKQGKKICSKCYNELVWDNNCCPSCGNRKYLPYYPNPARKISCINPDSF